MPAATIHTARSYPTNGKSRQLTKLCTMLASASAAGLLILPQPMMARNRSARTVAPAAEPSALEVMQALAPTGKLRVGLYVGGPTNIIPGPTAEQTKGVGFDLGKELARRLGVPFKPVIYPNAGGVMDSLKANHLDIAFLARTPERENTFNLTAPFLLIEHGYLTPAGSPISSIGSIDRTGTLIGTPQGGSVNAVLARTIHHATVVPIPGLATAAEMLKSGQVDVFAASKANLFELSGKLPGSHVLEGRIGVDEITIAVTKGREAGIPYLRQFLERAKSENLIAAAVRRANVRGVVDR